MSSVNASSMSSSEQNGVGWVQRRAQALPANGIIELDSVCAYWSGRVQSRNFISQFGCNEIVGIEPKDPICLNTCLVDGKMPLFTMCIKAPREHGYSRIFSKNGEGGISTAAVHDDNSLGPTQCRKRPVDVGFLVERQDDWSDVIEHVDRAMVMFKGGGTEQERLLQALTGESLFGQA
jgi:hypothetical protein